MSDHYKYEIKSKTKLGQGRKWVFGIANPLHNDSTFVLMKFLRGGIQESLEFVDVSL